jgi:hypothetical protein
MKYVWLVSGVKNGLRVIIGIWEQNERPRVEETMDEYAHYGYTGINAQEIVLNETCEIAIPAPLPGRTSEEIKPCGS